eukprot:12881358-Prorocentrum_lima.AAC.1
MRGIFTLSSQKGFPPSTEPMGTHHQHHLPSLLHPLKQPLRFEFWAALSKHPLRRLLGTEFRAALPEHNTTRPLGSK